MERKVVNTIIIIAGIGMLIYLYKRYNKKPVVKKQELPKIEMASEQDDITFMEKLQEKGFIVKIPTDKRKGFVSEYQKDITKADHNKVMELLKKDPSKWTLEEEFFYTDKFIDNVLTLDDN
jgi:ribosomal protein L16 Arg81 hydroxylase